jgi:hypothetical protein
VSAFVSTRSVSATAARQTETVQSSSERIQHKSTRLKSSTEHVTEASVITDGKKLE